MKALYFPDSYVPDRMKDILEACFEGTGVFMVSCDGAAGSESGPEHGIVAVVPREEQRRRVESFLRENREWARHHGGRARDYINSLCDPVPFFDESLSFRLKDEIRGIVEEHSGGDVSGDSLLSARAYLQAAHDLDREKSDIDKELSILSEKQDLILNELTGGEFVEGIFPDTESESAGNIGHGMESRLSAWSRIFLQGDEAVSWGDTRLFVTEKRSVIEHLIEIVPAIERIATVALPAVEGESSCRDEWRDMFSALLEFEAAGERQPAPGGLCHDEGAGGTVSVYTVPGILPADFFRWFINGTEIADSFPHVADGYAGLSTVLAVVTPRVIACKTEPM